MARIATDRQWYKATDGFLNFYVNVKTGHRRFKLRDCDVLVAKPKNSPWLF